MSKSPLQSHAQDIAGLLITQTININDNDVSLRIMYGMYKPQIDHSFAFADIEHHIHDALGQTSLHIQHTTAMTLRIVSIVLSDRLISHTQDGRLPHSPRCLTPSTSTPPLTAEPHLCRGRAC